MGEVYQAFDERLHRRVALKQIRSDLLDSDRSRARFLREARSVAGLNHPAIVQIHDILEDDNGDSWIVMELLDGHTLADELSEGPLPLQKVLGWALDIAEGLGEAHAHGIVHRDLKPANVAITRSGRVKILDFGLAKRVEPNPTDGPDPTDVSISVPGVVVGTGTAMSPEQAQGLEVDFRSDLFAFGTLIYQMLTGRSPFRGNSLVETLSRVLTFHPEPLHDVDPSIPEDFSAWVESLHEKSPELRPSSTQAVVDALVDFRDRAASEPGIPSDDVAEDLSATLAGPPNSAQASDPSNATNPPTQEPSGSNLSTSYFVIPRPWLAVLGIVGIGLAALWFGLRGDDTGNTYRKVPPSPPGMQDNAATQGSEQPADPTEDMGPQQLYQYGRDLLRDSSQISHAERAEQVFRKILEIHERSAPAYTGLAETLLWRYQDDNRDPSILIRARAAAEKAVELDGHFADARVVRGIVLFHQGELEESEDDLKTALVLQPNHSGAWYRKAQILDSQNEIDEAEKAYRQAISSNSQDRRFHDAIGDLYLKAGRYQEAEAAYRGSIAIAPRAVYGRRNLVAALYMQGQHAEAAQELQTALQIAPVPSLYANLGTLLFIQGLYVEAADAFEKALTMGTAANHYLYWANLADAYRWIPSKEQDAEKHYRRAIQLLKVELEGQPQNPTLQSRLALFLAKSGQPTDAMETIDRLKVDESPSADPTLDASSYYRLAVTFEICGHRDRALEALKQALQQGYSRQEIQLDPELDSLRTDPHFHLLMADLALAIDRTTLTTH